MFGVSSQSATFLTERVVGRWEGLRGELASDVDPAEEGLFERQSQVDKGWVGYCNRGWEVIGGGNKVLQMTKSDGKGR